MTLDMAWVPNLKLPPLSNNTFPLYAVMVALAKISSSMFVQKIILLLIIWLSGYGMHRLGRKESEPCMCGYGYKRKAIRINNLIILYHHASRGISQSAR